MLNYEFFDKIISIKNKKVEVETERLIRYEKNSYFRGSGYVGTAIISFFLENKTKVVNLDNLIYRQNNKFSFF